MANKKCRAVIAITHSKTNTLFAPGEQLKGFTAEQLSHLVEIGAARDESNAAAQADTGRDRSTAE